MALLNCSPPWFLGTVAVEISSPRTTLLLSVVTHHPPHCSLNYSAKYPTSSSLWYPRPCHLKAQLVRSSTSPWHQKESQYSLSFLLVWKSQSSLLELSKPQPPNLLSVVGQTNLKSFLGLDWVLQMSGLQVKCRTTSQTLILHAQWRCLFEIPHLVLVFLMLVSNNSKLRVLM